MKSSYDMDNRNTSDMNSYLEARIDALKRRIHELEQAAIVIPLAEAMVCLNCSSILRLGQTCCGDLSLLSGWLAGIDDRPIVRNVFRHDGHLGAVSDE